MIISEGGSAVSMHTCIVDGLAAIFGNDGTTVWPCSWSADKSSGECCAAGHVSSKANAQCCQWAACSGVSGTSSATTCCSAGVRGVHSEPHEGNDSARCSTCWRSNVCCRCTSPGHTAYYHCSWGNSICFLGCAIPSCDCKMWLARYVSGETERREN